MYREAPVFPGNAKKGRTIHLLFAKMKYLLQLRGAVDLVA